MGIVKKLVKGLLMLLAVLVLTSFLLPASKHVVRTRDIAVPPDRVWPLIAEPRQWSAWLLMEHSNDPARVRVDHALAPHTLQYRLEPADLGAGAIGQIRLDFDGAGTKVTWTLDTQWGINPVLRWAG